METPREKEKRNGIPLSHRETEIYQLIKQENSEGIDGTVEVTENDRKLHEKLRNLKILFWDLGRPDLDELYEKLDAKIKIADGKLPETDADNAEELESGEIPQDLKDFREAWEEKISGDGSKEKIIKAAKNIPVKVETESDGSRLIEFELWNKRYKILDPKLKTHSDDEYFANSEFLFIRKKNEWVELWWMRWDDVTKWKNKKLANYVKQKEKQWLHIPKIEEMKAILTEIWESAGLDGESDQMAMLMYLTWMDWWYWLSMWDDETSGSQDSRSGLNCNGDGSYFDYYGNDHYLASLCMIACQ